MPLLTMPQALLAVEDCLKEYCLGSAQMPPRVVLDPSKGWMGIMAAYLEKANALATKIVTVFSENLKLGLPTTMGILIYIDPSTGFPLSVMDAGYLTAVRTGAISGIATKYLARKNAETLGVLGCGNQAETQVEAISIIRTLRRVRVYDIDLQRKQNFAKKISEKLGLKVEPAENSQEAAEGCDIIVTATSSPTPVLFGEWLKQGVHINAIGAYSLDTRELDDEAIRRAKIVVDSKNASLKDAGDIIIPLTHKVISPKSIHAELGEIILGKEEGRTSEKEITLFKSSGLAIQDAAVAKIVYENALSLGIGIEIEML